MNKKISVALFFLCLLLLSIIAVCQPLKKHTTAAAEVTLPKSTLLINTLHNNGFSMKLFYGDLSQERFQAIDVSPKTLSFDAQSYLSCADHLMPSDQCHLLTKAVNDYRLGEGLESITAFDHYTEADDYIFLSLDQGLYSLYRIDPEHMEVTAFSQEKPEAAQYIYHLTSGSDTYYVLTYQPEHHIVTWYALSKKDLSLTDIKHILPPAGFQNRNQCALDDKGNAYFTSNNELLMITPEDAHHINLDFSPDYVFYQEGQLYTLSLSEFFLSYAAFDGSSTLSSSGQVNLPNKEVSLTASFIKENQLYTICQDLLHPIFRNYITIYDLSTHEMTYCLAIRDHSNNILLNGVLLQ